MKVLGRFFSPTVKTADNSDVLNRLGIRSDIYVPDLIKKDSPDKPRKISEIIEEKAEEQTEAYMDFLRRIMNNEPVTNEELARYGKLIEDIKKEDNPSIHQTPHPEVGIPLYQELPSRPPRNGPPSDEYDIGRNNPDRPEYDSPHGDTWEISRTPSDQGPWD